MYWSLPDVEIEHDDKFKTLGAEIKSACLTMLHVTPEYVVLVRNSADIVVAEDESELPLQLQGCIAARLAKSSRGPPSTGISRP